MATFLFTLLRKSFQQKSTLFINIVVAFSKENLVLCSKSFLTLLFLRAIDKVSRIDSKKSSASALAANQGEIMAAEVWRTSLVMKISQIPVFKAPFAALWLIKI